MARTKLNTQQALDAVTYQIDQISRKTANLDAYSQRVEQCAARIEKAAEKEIQVSKFAVDEAETRLNQAARDAVAAVEQATEQMKKARRHDLILALVAAGLAFFAFFFAFKYYTAETCTPADKAMIQELKKNGFVWSLEQPMPDRRDRVKKAK